jgi:hypothetical protein
MATTNPYFIRDQLTDVPGQKGPSWSSCPDIIFSTSGAPNWTPQMGSPSSYITAAGYATDYGSTVQTDGMTVNYVYLRALNTNPGANIATRLWFMFAQSNMALWPQDWRKDGIMVGNQQAARNYQDGVDIMSGGPGPYVVTQQPFLWQVKAPDPGQHYCCIAMAEPFPNADPDNSLSDPPFAPPSTIGYMSTLDQLAQFILTTNWFGWRNTIDVSTLGQTWTQVIPVTGPDAGGMVNVGIQCVKMPTDGFVSATMAGPDPQNSLNLPKTPIKLPNMNVFVPITLPPAFKTNMVINYWQGATAPPYMATIAPLLQLPNSAVDAILKGRKPLRRPTWSRIHDPVTMQFQGWQKVHTIGSVPLTWDTQPQVLELRGLVSVPRSLPDAIAPAPDRGATSNQSWQVEGPAQAGRIYAGIQCRDMPVGAEVAISMPGPDPANGIELPPTPITAPNQAFLVALEWPANFSTIMSVTYWGPSPAPGGGITPVILQPDGGLTASEAPPTWQQTIPITGPDQAGLVNVGIQTQDMPTDGFVAFTIPDPDGCQIQKSPISVPNMVIFCSLNWPLGHQTEMTISYWEGATPPPSGASVAPYLGVFSS